MSDYLFPREKKPFNEVFPDIEKLEIVVKILNSSGHEVDEKVYSNIHFPVDGIACGHVLCKNGGLNSIRIVSAISKIYKNKELEYSDYILCNGGRYKGRTRYDSCGWAFKLFLQAKYK